MNEKTYLDEIIESIQILNKQELAKLRDKIRARIVLLDERDRLVQHLSTFKSNKV